MVKLFLNRVETTEGLTSLHYMYVVKSRPCFNE